MGLSMTAANGFIQTDQISGLIKLVISQQPSTSPVVFSVRLHLGMRDCLSTKGPWFERQKGLQFRYFLLISQKNLQNEKSNDVFTKFTYEIKETK